ncbi:unnamed protein product [Didymodactylos carnosus]|uniref:Protein kinase domain-containing protein n=1 Tax=Didymodactylos carnosus TaxID=1234261 RepID=A0A8S2D9T4_9BILA|nr:unnamed protein product [Didymodactylos carnosus]CAF3657630.1 unnamed protein product [Didymodactylos carnosus]
MDSLRNFDVDFMINNTERISNGAGVGIGKQRQARNSNWSSLGSLNSFGESVHQSTTTPPSSQDLKQNGVSSSSGQRETLHSRFEFKQTLGKGTYGKVKLALDKRKNEQVTNPKSNIFVAKRPIMSAAVHFGVIPVAIKTIKKSRIENPHDLARIRREIDFMTGLNHPHVIKIKEVYESREKIILVMEYASGGELYDYLNRMKRIPESEARAIFRQIVSAVHFLHKNQIVHRDLKLENILIDHNGDIKLADFGLSNSWSPRRLLHTFCGSPLYASPEIVSGIPYYGPEVDCWSLGVLLYTLVYGSMPFQGGDYNRLVRNITSGEFIQPREQSGALGLIRKCLTVIPSKRSTIDDIAEHWWVNLGFKCPPVYFHTYTPRKNGGVQALPFETFPTPNSVPVQPQPAPLPPPQSFHPVTKGVPVLTNGNMSSVGPSSKANSITSNNHLPQNNTNYSNSARNHYHNTTTATTNNAPVPNSNYSNNNTNAKSNYFSRRTTAERNGIRDRALPLIQFCLKPDASLRATTKDIMRHNWLCTGPLLSLRLHSSIIPSDKIRYRNSIAAPTTTISHSSLDQTSIPSSSPPPIKNYLRSTNDQNTTNDDHRYSSSMQSSSTNNRYSAKNSTDTPISTANDSSPLTPVSATDSNSLVELELNTSSFFSSSDLTRSSAPAPQSVAALRNKDLKNKNHRASAIPVATRHLFDKPDKSYNSKSEQKVHRPLSLSLDDKHDPNDFHFVAAKRSSIKNNNINGNTYNSVFDPVSSSPYAFKDNQKSTLIDGSSSSFDIDNKNHHRQNGSNNGVQAVLRKGRQTISPTSPSRLSVDLTNILHSNSIEDDSSKSLKDQIYSPNSKLRPSTTNTPTRYTLANARSVSPNMKEKRLLPEDHNILTRYLVSYDFDSTRPFSSPIKPNTTVVNNSVESSGKIVPSLAGSTIISGVKFVTPTMRTTTWSDDRNNKPRSDDRNNKTKSLNGNNMFEIPSSSKYMDEMNAKKNNYNTNTTNSSDSYIKKLGELSIGTNTSIPALNTTTTVHRTNPTSASILCSLALPKRDSFHSSSNTPRDSCKKFEDNTNNSLMQIRIQE